MKKIILVLSICMQINILFADDFYGKDYNERSPFRPDHLKGQFAGNIGFISAGFGYESFGGKLSSDLLLGYVPEFIGNATIFTIVQKNTIRGKNLRIKHLQHVYPLAGFSINVETGNNSFLTLPDYYPNGYYSTNAVTFSFFAGAAYQGKVRTNSFFKQIEYYAEVGTLGTYIYYNIKRKEYLNPDILSLAFGINIKI